MGVQLPLRLQAPGPAGGRHVSPAMWGVGAAVLVTLAIGAALAGGGAFLVACAAMIGGGGIAAIALRGAAASHPAEAATGLDLGLLRATMTDSRDAGVLTDRRGRLVCTAPLYDEWFGAPRPPDTIAFESDGPARLAAGLRQAWRDGEAEVRGLAHGGRHYAACSAAPGSFRIISSGVSGRWT